MDDNYTDRRAMPGLAYPEKFLARLSEDLTMRFAGIFSAETVDRYVMESYASLLRTSTVKAFLAANTVRFATDRLTALAQSKGDAAHDVPEVLFVCVQNAGRSQMAAALTEHFAAGSVHVRSAGSTPSDQINPAVISAMSELGIDLSHEFPKPLTDDVVRAADVVITMGCGDACPIYPGKRYLDWELTDPSGMSVESVREIRDEISHRVTELLAELVPGT